MQKKLKFEKIFEELKNEESQGKFSLHLTANEPVMSPLAQKWQASVLNSRYALGSLRERGKRQTYFFKKNFSLKGIPAFDELESLARDACGKMFDCADADFRALSGLHGMTCVIGSLTNPGDLVATLPPQFIGHFATAKLLERMGRRNIFLPYNPAKFELNLEAMKKIARNNRVKMVYLDTMHYFKPYPLREIKKLFPNAILVYDGSHILGLIAGGKFQNPLKEGADILNGNTHKTLPGPQKGMILYKDKELAGKSKKIIGDAFVSSSHTGATISLFITLLEMLYFGKEYAAQIVKNSQALAASLTNEGFSVLGYPEIKPLTHQVLLIADSENDGPKLIKAGISVNSFPLFGKNIIRLGVQQITRLGMKEREMKCIAELIKRILKNKTPHKAENEIKKLNKHFNRVCYCFSSAVF